MSKTQISPQANPDRIERILNLRRSSAAGPQDRGRRKLRTRGNLKVALRKGVLV